MLGVTYKGKRKLQGRNKTFLTALSNYLACIAAVHGACC